jgi:hypothetical protein
MPGTPRQPPRQVFRGLGVVEHQQPPVPAPQLTQRRPPRRAQVRVRPGAAQTGGQRRDLLPDQPGLLGGDPPHHVIARREPVRVLCRQLRLAHPAHPRQRLHHRPPPGKQRLAHIGQHLIPAGEPRIPRRDIPPHRRQHPRQPRPRPAQTTQRPRPPRKPRRSGGPGRAGHRGQQHPPRLPLGHPEHIPRHQRAQQRRHQGRGHLLHPHRHQPPRRHPRQMHQRRRPLLSGIPLRLEIRRREQRHHPVRPRQRLAHRRHEVPARRPIPHIQLDRVPGIN